VGAGIHTLGPLERVTYDGRTILSRTGRLHGRIDAIEHPAHAKPVSTRTPIGTPRHVLQPEHIASAFREQPEQSIGPGSFFELEIDGHVANQRELAPCVWSLSFPWSLVGPL